MECVYCGKKLETSDRRIHYCSEECRLKSYRQQQKLANRKRRENDEEYLRKTCEANRQRYHKKKHERFVELAVKIQQTGWNTAELVRFLEDSFRLRH